MTTITAPPDYIWAEEIEVVRQQRPELLKSYLESHGLSELPRPRWVDVENATVFHRTASGDIDSFRLRLADYSGGALVALMERGLLLAPPEQTTPAGDVETAVETDPDPTERTGQAESQTDKRFSCDLRMRNNKPCRRKYVHKGALTNHQKKKHYGVTK